MSGLFDTLSARFAPGAQPAIRPRPQLRFEGRAEGPGIREETGEAIARAPRSTPTSTHRSAARPASQDQDPPAIALGPSQQASQDITPSVPRATAQDSAPAPKNSRDIARKTVAQSALIAVRPETGHDRPDPAPHSRDTSATNDPANGAVAEPSSESAPLTERIIETTVQAAPPAANRAEQRATLPIAEAGAAPVAKSEPPIIRIGRIEVSRPAPPAPPPPKPAPARPEPPRRAAPAARAPSPSRLTDYLGWKK